LATPLSSGLIDTGSLAEWVDGVERPPANPGQLRQLVWTQSSSPAAGPWPGMLRFGISSQPGPRSLRIGFTHPISLGSVLVRGGGALSYLRPGAPYPGNLGDQSQWLDAQRIAGNQAGSAEAAEDDYALWVLPPGVSTRALRFTHVAAQTDPSYEGFFGGACLLAGRFANLAPSARVSTSANQADAPLLVDGKNNRWWSGWDNGPAYHHLVTPQSPEWIILSWPHPVALRGLAALWAGFGAADVQVFTGPDSAQPQNAPEADWKPAAAGSSLRNQYPRPLGVDWFDFGRTLSTRAIRLRITAVTDEAHHPHLKGKTRNGMRVWLGELMAFSPLGNAAVPAALQSLVPASPQPSPPASSGNANSAIASPHGPIPITFNLAAPAFVTLVIEDAQGNRVRNLVSDTHFDAGRQTVWWNAADDLERDPNSAEHGVYRIPTHFVSPGRYTVRGLTHQPIDLRYEFSAYNSGHPPWETLDGKGGWMTNHTPPSSALFVPPGQAPGGKPLVYLGSYVSEGGSGLQWIDLDGNKQGGRGWVGGNWTGAQYLARDTGPDAQPEAQPSVFAYVASAWDAAKSPAATQPSGATQPTAGPQGAIRITALTSSGDLPIKPYPIDPLSASPNALTLDQRGRPQWGDQLGGLAVRNRVLVLSLTRIDRLAFLDAQSGAELATASVPSPRGIAFDAQGRLLVLSATHLLRYASPLHPQALSAPQTLIAGGLEDPTGIALDDAGNIYISDRGASHQVKVFAGSGSPLRTIGHPGPPQAGPYDPLHMNNPRGLAIDSNHHLWVAEEDFQPKRVSEWTLDGKLLHAFYGPAQYGGGGTLDPRDKSLFYYNGMEFHLDWAKGQDTLSSIYFRPPSEDPSQTSAPATVIDGFPETPLYSGGHRYFTNCFTGHPTRGVDIATLYLDVNGIARLAAAMGRASAWPLLKSPPFAARWPAGVDPAGNTPDQALFLWWDRNHNGQVDPDEVTMTKASTGWLTIMPDLSFVDAFVDGSVMRYPPQQTAPDGVPSYDLHHAQAVVQGAQKPASDGDGQVLIAPEGIVMTTAPKPFAPESLGGVDPQGHRWSYPNLWPGLHPSHSAPLPDSPGELVGTTRLLGEMVRPRSGEALWAINGNYGEIDLFTADGLMVDKLFQDMRIGKPWTMPSAQRNMLLNGVSLKDENFYPSIAQTSDGNIYLVDGLRTSIVRVDGLNSIERIPAQSIEVTAAQIRQSQANLLQAESARQQAVGSPTMTVPLLSSPPSLESLLTPNAATPQNWVTIDRRSTTVGWEHSADLVEASVTVASGRLYAAFRTQDPNLLLNSGEVQNAPFKTGGALDLMIGANPSADPSRQSPVEGDLRLLVYLVQGKPHAMLYRARVPGTQVPIEFSSPDRTITLDQVADVSSQLQFAARGGNYAFSIPLATVSLNPAAGQKIKADIGILRGNGVSTIQRVYWSNKATGITSDVPSEAQLTPNLWGEWVFSSEK
jgi:hypothetical protein